LNNSVSVPPVSLLYTLIVIVVVPVAASTLAQFLNVHRFAGIDVTPG
jgi:hypothetical protein